MINVFAAVATGGAVVASQYLGAKTGSGHVNPPSSFDRNGDHLAVGDKVILFQRGLLHLLYGNLEPDVMKNALVYLVISAASYPFLAIYNSCAALFRSMGNSKISMQVSVVMNGINIFGDAVLFSDFIWGWQVRLLHR